MTCELVHASYSLPEWQAVKLTFFAPSTPVTQYNVYSTAHKINDNRVTKDILHVMTVIS